MKKFYKITAICNEGIYKYVTCANNRIEAIEKHIKTRPDSIYNDKILKIKRYYSKLYNKWDDIIVKLYNILSS